MTPHSTHTFRYTSTWYCTSKSQVRLCAMPIQRSKVIESISYVEARSEDKTEYTTFPHAASYEPYVSTDLRFLLSFSLVKKSADQSDPVHFNVWPLNNNDKLT